MVKLNNIVLDEKTIRCDFYPEDSKLPGHLVVDVETREIIEYTFPTSYENCKNHLYKAKSRLLHFLDTKQIPPKDKTILIMWY